MKTKTQNPDNIKLFIRTNIIWLRKFKNNITQKELAKKLHLTVRAIGAIEEGRTMCLNPFALKKACDLFGVTADEMLYKDLAI